MERNSYFEKSLPKSKKVSRKSSCARCNIQLYYSCNARNQLKGVINVQEQHDGKVVRYCRGCSVDCLLCYLRLVSSHGFKRCCKCQLVGGGVGVPYANVPRLLGFVEIVTVVIAVTICYNNKRSEALKKML